MFDDVLGLWVLSWPQIPWCRLVPAHLGVPPWSTALLSGGSLNVFSTDGARWPPHVPC